MRTAKLILNPAAGRGRAGTLLADIRSTLKAHDIETDVAQTRMAREAIDLAQRAKEDGHELIIAAGGDGTLHEVVNGLARAAGDGVAGTLGLIAIGSGNDFAKMIPVPIDWRAACEQIARGQTRRVDVGCVNGEYFTNNLGIGFEAQVGLEARKIWWARGTTIYAAALARTLLVSYRTPHVQIELDGEHIKQNVTLISLGNGRCTGGGFWMTPHAMIDDGLFDVCIGHQMTKLQMLGLVPHVMRGTHVDKPLVRMTRARRVTITSDEPLPMHADGETVQSDFHQRIEAELLPQKLEVIA
jgi:YegS/Rv2252/BmrU family lipid kinase